MMYTAVNIPYGSLASVVTDDEKERSSLSMWRSIGAGVGGLPGTILFPMLVYNTTIAADGTKIQTLNGTKLTIGVAILAVISVAVYFGHYKLTKERIAPVKKKKAITMHSKQSAILQKQTFCYALPCLNAAYRFPVLLSINISISFCRLLPQRKIIFYGNDLHIFADGNSYSHYE